LTSISTSISRRVFRSPFAVVLWWAWALFALANLADLAVQGRDRFSLLVALGLVTATGAIYATALRPRIIADDDGLVIVNPLRDHRIPWPAVAAVEAAELVRVRCEWPADRPGTGPAAGAGPDAGTEPGAEARTAAGADADGLRRRVIYAWAVHSSRRSQAAARARGARRGDRRDSGGSGGPRYGVFGGGGGYPPPGAPGLRYGSNSQGVATGSAPAMDAGRVAAELTELALGRDPGKGEPGKGGTGRRGQVPASRWSWPSLAAILVPAVILLIVALV
jgi:hypothetical protein